MPNPAWRLQDAKAQFSAVVDAALNGEAQVVTRRGKRAVVVLAADEYERLRQGERAKAPGFIDHLLAVPRVPSRARQQVERRPAVALRDVVLD
jgi:prevent-host-death family protein